MAGVLFFADNNVRQPIVDALRTHGYDVVRAVDVFGPANDDEELLAWSVANSRIFLTCDKRMQRLLHRWLEEGRTFRVISWWLELHRQMTDGQMVEAIEDVVTRPDAFTYPIEYIKPRR